MATKFESSVDRRVIAKAFSYWMIRQRGRLLERVRDQRFLQETLEIWRERFEGIHEALDSASQIIQQTRATKVMISIMQIWGEALAFHREESNLATVRLPSNNPSDD
jgi:hypothetical protein